MCWCIDFGYNLNSSHSCKFGNLFYIVACVNLFAWIGTVFGQLWIGFWHVWETLWIGNVPMETIQLGMWHADYCPFYSLYREIIAWGVQHQSSKSAKKKKTSIFRIWNHFSLALYLNLGSSCIWAALKIRNASSSSSYQINCCKDDKPCRAPKNEFALMWTFNISLTSAFDAQQKKNKLNQYWFDIWRDGKCIKKGKKRIFN